MQRHIYSAGLISLASLTLAGSALALDIPAAESLARKSKCMICHSVDKKKEAPSFKEVTAKYKGKPEAMAKITKHVTEPSTVKVDGKDEEHGLVKTKNADEVKNLVEWILSR